MGNLIRLLLRFILVPLGYCAAAIAGTLVFVGASMHLVDVALGGHPDGPIHALSALILGGWIVGIFAIAYMALPASVGILISEAFAIRSWVYHALNGVAAAWVGFQVYEGSAGRGLQLDQPLVIAAAGLAGGFAYWAVAGFSAGFWKPVFRRSEAAEAAIPR
jgi:hypothetical protein